MVHFTYKDHRIYFEVYPIQVWGPTPTGEKGFDYLDKEDPITTREVFEEDKCLKKFEGSFCWRGVWEGRLYFTSDEYWGEEISEMSELYDNHIVPWCKDFVKRCDPNNHY